MSQTRPLLAGDERGAAAAEGVEHDAVRHAGVENRIGQHGDRLHGRVVGVFLRFVEFPDGGLLPVGVPFMFAGFLPAEQDRLMLPLIRRATEDQRLLFQMQVPDK